MLRILEANPAAIRALGFARGRDLLLELAQDEREAFRAMLQRVRQHGRAPGIVLHLGQTREAWTARATLMTSEPGQMFMVQLAPAGIPGQTQSRQEQISLDDFIERLPDAFVVIDRGGIIRRANRAFLDLLRVGAEGAVLNERLGRWLSKPGADLGVLLSHLNRHGIVRMFATSILCELGDETAVEISAIGNSTGKPSLVALLIRDVSRRVAPDEAAANLQSALAAVIEHGGTSSLRDLVKDAVGLVERHYMAAALDLAEGNRTAAAEILGLSRQGFYKKLAQYEMEGHSKPVADLES
jgi:transcriptional regulator PpsR